MKLIAIIASEQKLGLKFWGVFVVYRVLLALPYLVLLFLGDGILGDIFKSIIIGLLVAGLLLSLLRFFAAGKIISLLWYFYGFVYDGLLNFYPYRKLVSDVITFSSRDLPEEPKNILEIGCGTGNVLVALQEHYPGAKVTGVDISSSMLKVAKKKTNASLAQTDAHSFLLATNEVYNMIILQNSLYAIPERQELWKELFSALSPGGTIIITNSDLAGSKTIIREHLAHDSWWKLLHPKLLLIGLIDSFISQLSTTGAFNFIPEKDLRREIAYAGGAMSSVERAYGGVNILFSVKDGDEK
jgi:ubiquinone/menaquinone biosynthesis C-methylase UbiE